MSETAPLRPLAAHDDARRGVNLLARPAPPVADALTAFLAELREVEPEQYDQPRPDLHLTVLSLFTATADYAPYLAHVGAYRAAVAEALAARGLGGALDQRYRQETALAAARGRVCRRTFISRTHV